MGIYAYKLDEATREGLLAAIPPAYGKVYADHITYQLAKPGESMPELDKAEIIGIADDGKGLQAAIVRINGSLERPDGKIYHVTWSLDEQAMAPAAFDSMAKPGKEKEKPYRPVHSNGLLAQIIATDGTLKTPANPNWKVTMLDKPLRIGADAVHIGDDKVITPVKLHGTETKSMQPGSHIHSVSPEAPQRAL